MKRFVLLGVGPRGLYAHEWVPRHATDGKLVADGSRADDGVRSPQSSIAPYRHAGGPVIERSVRPWAGSSPRPISRDRSPSGTFVQGCRLDGHRVTACHRYDTWSDTNKAAVSFQYSSLSRHDLDGGCSNTTMAHVRGGLRCTVALLSATILSSPNPRWPLCGVPRWNHQGLRLSPQTVVLDIFFAPWGYAPLEYRLDLRQPAHEPLHLLLQPGRTA